MFSKKIINFIKLGFWSLIIGMTITTCDYADVENSGSSSFVLDVQIIDVGQADCTLIKMPDGQNMLIDAGNNSDGGYLVDYLESEDVEKIDYLIGTHPHADHIGGMDDIIENFEIGKIYMPRVTSNTQTFEEVLQAIKDKGLKIETATAGKTVLEGEVFAQFISPVGEYYEELNDYSAVLKLTYGSKSFLFMGDAEALAEKEILQKFDVKSDVLKVGHHGSSTSSHNAFLKAVNPEIAVISVGEGNDYGHPHKSVLKRLEKIGTRLYRTDLNGTVKVYCDGKSIEVKCEKGE